MDGKDKCRREIFFLSEESQRILTTDVWGKRAKSERLVEDQREWTHKRSKTELVLLLFSLYLSFLVVQTEQAWFYITNTIESRSLEVAYTELKALSRHLPSTFCNPWHLPLFFVSLIEVRSSGVQLYFNRCGVYRLQGWLNTRPQLERDVLFPLFESVFDELRTFVIQNCFPKMEVRDPHTFVLKPIIAMSSKFVA